MKVNAGEIFQKQAQGTSHHGEEALLARLVQKPDIEHLLMHPKGGNQVGQVRRTGQSVNAEAENELAPQLNVWHIPRGPLFRKANQGGNIVKHVVFGLAGIVSKTFDGALHPAGNLGVVHSKGFQLVNSLLGVDICHGLQLGQLNLDPFRTTMQVRQGRAGNG